MVKMEIEKICGRVFTGIGLFVWLGVVNCTVADEYPWRVVTEHAPPFQNLNSGVLTGRAVERVRPLLRSAGIGVDIEVFPWARAFELARTRKNTLIFSIVRLKEREPLFQWIGLIEETRLSFISLASNKNVTINNIEDARRYGIGAVRNDFNHRYLLSEGFHEKEHFVLRSNISELLGLLVKERIEVMLVDMSFVTQILPATGLTTKDIKIHLQPENSVRDIYLAAHIDSDKVMVDKLRQLFSK